jgi:hypothetical protein
MKRDDIGLDTIKCPNCGDLIPVNETLYHQISEKARTELKAEALVQQKALTDREKEIAVREQNVQKAVEDQVKLERDKLKKEAEKKAHDAVAVEVEDLKRQTSEKDEKIKNMVGTELELRKLKNQLEDEKVQSELETARRIDQERSKIREEALKQFQEQYHLKDAEKDKKLQDAMRMNEELSRKLQQGSQQTQGEVLELELEELIKNTFPVDQVEPVPKGVRGADVIQRVMNRSGHLCGTIVWELKRTKEWSDVWIQKFKDDQRIVKAEIAILVSEALPKEIENFGLMDGIWVTNLQCAIGLAVALRMQLIEVATVKLTAVGKNEKMEIIYQYLTGAEFKQRVEAIVEAFKEMAIDLQEERRVAERRWAKREKQIQKVISNTSGMYGDFQGLIGSSLQSIPALTTGNHDEEEKDSSEKDV